MRKVALMPIVLLLAFVSSCTTEETQAAVSTINPWEPIDPGFLGCEGG